jgi:putative phage-type endonuclease
MEQTIELRRSGIGGSDSAAVLGIDKYRTPLDVYYEKIGLTGPIEETEAMYFGKILEEVIAEEFSRRTGLKVQRVNRTLRDKDSNFLMAHLDRKVVGRKAAIECKTAGKWWKADEWGESGSDQIPMSYFIQCQHQALVADLEVVYLPALLAGNDFRIFEIPRNNNVIKEMKGRLISFWNDNVNKKIPPAPVNYDDVKKLWKVDLGTSIPATDEMIQKVEKYRKNQGIIKPLEEENKTLKFEITAYMKGNKILTDKKGEKLISHGITKKQVIDTETLETKFPRAIKKYKKLLEYKSLR